MNQITKEELSAYLVHKPKAKMLNYKCDYVGKEIDTIIGIEQWDKSGQHWSLFTEGGSKPSLSEIKLLLRPLSQLTTEIEVNGEKVIPLYILEGCINNYDTYHIELLHSFWINKIKTKDLKIKEYRLLASMHFDLEDLIDRNLAEPIV